MLSNTPKNARSACSPSSGCNPSSCLALQLYVHAQAAILPSCLPSPASPQGHSQQEERVDANKAFSTQQRPGAWLSEAASRMDAGAGGSADGGGGEGACAVAPSWCSITDQCHSSGSRNSPAASRTSVSTGNQATSSSSDSNSNGSISNGSNSNGSNCAKAPSSNSAKNRASSVSSPAAAAAAGGSGESDGSGEQTEDREKLEQLATEHEQLKRRLVESEDEVCVCVSGMCVCVCIRLVSSDGRGRS